jgi:hypothetical protein
MSKTPDQLTLDELATFGAAAALEAVQDLKRRGIATAGADVELVGDYPKQTSTQVKKPLRQAS